jgi:hypothetical protein
MNSDSDSPAKREPPSKPSTMDEFEDSAVFRSAETSPETNSDKLLLNLSKISNSNEQTKRIVSTSSEELVLKLSVSDSDSDVINISSSENENSKESQVNRKFGLKIKRISSDFITRSQTYQQTNQQMPIKNNTYSENDMFNLSQAWSSRLTRNEKLKRSCSMSSSKENLGRLLLEKKGTISAKTANNKKSTKNNKNAKSKSLSYSSQLINSSQSSTYSSISNSQISSSICTPTSHADDYKLHKCTVKVICAKLSHERIKRELEELRSKSVSFKKGLGLGNGKVLPNTPVFSNPYDDEKDELDLDCDDSFLSNKENSKNEKTRDLEKNKNQKVEKKSTLHRENVDMNDDQNANLDYTTTKMPVYEKKEYGTFSDCLESNSNTSDSLSIEKTYTKKYKTNTFVTSSNSNSSHSSSVLKTTTNKNVNKYPVPQKPTSSLTKTLKKKEIVNINSSNKSLSNQPKRLDKPQASNLTKSNINIRKAPKIVKSTETKTPVSSEKKFKIPTLKTSSTLKTSTDLNQEIPTSAKLKLNPKEAASTTSSSLSSSSLSSLKKTKILNPASSDDSKSLNSMLKLNRLKTTQNTQKPASLLEMLPSQNQQMIPKNQPKTSSILTLSSLKESSPMSNVSSLKYTLFNNFLIKSQYMQFFDFKLLNTHFPPPRRDSFVMTDALKLELFNLQKQNIGKTNFFELYGLDSSMSANSLAQNDADTFIFSEEYRKQSLLEFVDKSPFHDAFTLYSSLRERFLTPFRQIDPYWIEDKHLFGLKIKFQNDGLTSVCNHKYTEELCFSCINSGIHRKKEELILKSIHGGFSSEILPNDKKVNQEAVAHVKLSKLETFKEEIKNNKFFEELVCQNVEINCKEPESTVSSRREVQHTNFTMNLTKEKRKLNQTDFSHIDDYHSSSVERFSNMKKPKISNEGKKTLRLGKFEFKTKYEDLKKSIDISKIENEIGSLFEKNTFF